MSPLRFATMILPAFLILVVLSPITRPEALGKASGDAFQFWYAGHIVATGSSPYDSSEWRAAGERYGDEASAVAAGCSDPDPDAAYCNWIYPPLTAWLYAPVGALPVDIGLAVLNMATLALALCGIVAAVIFFGPRDTSSRALLLAIASAWHPMVTTLACAHPIGVLLLGVVGIGYGLRRRKIGALILGALIIAVKPHVALAVIVAVPAILIHRRAWRALAWTSAALAVVAAGAVLAYPDALPSILEHSRSKASIAWATSAGLSATTGIPVWMIVAVGAAAAMVAVRSAFPAYRSDVVIAAAAGLSLLVTPYVQPYDYLLAFPALAVAAQCAGFSRIRGIVLAAITFVALVGTWSPLFVHELAHAYAVTAVGALIIIAVATTARRESARRSFAIVDAARSAYFARQGRAS